MAVEEAAQPTAERLAPLGGSVIPIVNKLQDVFAQLGSQSMIELPQVAVVGSQSSGKSSVLEALVGRDFLPRGNEICTRCPLVLQLLQTKCRADGGTDEEWGEFRHLPGKRFYDFSQIRREIQAETYRIAGENKGVSSKQIRLKIFSPNVLDITLVDLPGITKVPVGDQPSDIEAQIRTMIMSYIKQPSCLILAVSSANSDLANSDALQIAGMADPDGHRTIGVITKLDIMDRGTDARNLLLGKVIPLRLGYVGVVNRCQEDILLNRSIKDALVAEEKFFRSHPVYNGLADCCGVPQLAKRLNQILVQHIKNLLPNLKSRIRNAFLAAAKEYESFGEVVESKDGQGSLLLKVLSEYSEAFSSMLAGKFEEMSTSEVFGGARIHYIFQSIFVKSLEEADAFDDLTDDDIRTAIQNATGPRSALFVPEVPFEVLVRRQIARLLDPSLQCARYIFDELIKISHHCAPKELKRFPVLRRRMGDVIGNFLREGLEPSETMIGHIIEMEMDYINTSHPSFIGGTKAAEIATQQVKSSRLRHSIPLQKEAPEPDKLPVLERSQRSRAVVSRQMNGVIVDQGERPATDTDRVVSSGKAGASSWGISSLFRGSNNRVAAQESLPDVPYIEAADNLDQNTSLILLREPPAVLKPPENQSEVEAIEIAIMKLLLRSYYDIVRKNVEDYVPKAIMHFLVNHTKRELFNVLVRKLYRENLYEDLLQEPEDVAIRRKRAKENFRVLQLAETTLDELPVEAESVGQGYGVGPDLTVLSRSNPMPESSMYSTSSGSGYAYGPSWKVTKSQNVSHPGELDSPLYTTNDFHSNGRLPMSGLYPMVEP